MTTRRRGLVAATVGLIAILAGLWVRESWRVQPVTAVEASSPLPQRSHEVEPGATVAPVLTDQLRRYENDPLVGGLLDPAGSATRDLEIVAGVLEAWQSNFPGQGNPGGENFEITAALTGRNRLRLELIPVEHPAINPRGELCDRWATPFFFHQLSGTQMELRSAGPDREYYTPDDLVWTP